MGEYKPPLPPAPETVNWRGIESAPRDGTIIAVKFSPWKNASYPPSVQAAQWIGDEWCIPFERGSIAYADAWAPADEVTAAMFPQVIK